MSNDVKQTLSGFTKGKYEISNSEMIAVRCIIAVLCLISLSANAATGFLMIKDNLLHQVLVSAVFFSLNIGIFANAFLNAKRRIHENIPNDTIRKISFCLVVLGVLSGIFTLSNMLLSALGYDTFKVFGEYMNVSENSILATFVILVALLVEIYVAVLITNQAAFYCIGQYNDFRMQQTSAEVQIAQGEIERENKMFKLEKARIESPAKLKIVRHNINKKVEQITGKK